MAVPPALIKKAIMFKAKRKLNKGENLGLIGKLRRKNTPLKPPPAPKQNLTPIYLIGGVIILALLLKK